VRRVIPIASGSASAASTASAGLIRRWIGSAARRLLRDRTAAAAVEFAIIGPTFLLLLLAILELGYMVFVQSVLDAAARDAARLIRTGQVQTSGNATQTFQNKLCSDVGWIIGCGNIIFQAQVFNDWNSAQTSVNKPPKRDKYGNLISAGFSAGSSRQIIAVQVTYNYQFYTQWVASYLGGGTNSAFLSSTVVFQNEPFPS
jgi:Flp pilus assembly protein TadG